MRYMFLKLLLLTMTFLNSATLFSQDFQLINKQMFNDLDAVQNICSKKIVVKNYLNGNPKEIGIYVKKLVKDKKINGYVGFHVKYYVNGAIKDSIFWDKHSNLNGIAKGYFRNGQIKYIGIGKDISIADGMHYSKNRTGLSDSFEIYYYKNGNKKLEFGSNFQKASNWSGDGAICTISYNKDGTIKSSLIYDIK
jgi:antitoxin component YwqK of YwqJK toxin-antitoxin module